MSYPIHPKLVYFHPLDRILVQRFYFRDLGDLLSLHACCLQSTSSHHHKHKFADPSQPPQTSFHPLGSQDRRTHFYQHQVFFKRDICHQAFEIGLWSHQPRQMLLLNGFLHPMVSNGLPLLASFGLCLKACLRNLLLLFLILR